MGELVLVDELVLINLTAVESDKLMKAEVYRDQNRL